MVATAAASTRSTELAAAAYERGISQPAESFVANGSETNWSVWRQLYSHFTPILDFVITMMYVYAGTITGQPPNDGWSDYCLCAEWLWKGEMDSVLAVLERRYRTGPSGTQRNRTPRAEWPNR